MVEVRRRKSRWGTGDPAKGKEVPDNQKHARSSGEEESQWEEKWGRQKGISETSSGAKHEVCPTSWDSVDARLSDS